MKTMRELIRLVEGRYKGTPLLYHSTNTENAKAIISSGTVEPNTEAVINGKSRHGVSLTRSVGFASAFYEIVFGFDAIRIRNRFGGRLVPYADPDVGDSEYHADYRREAEEFLMASLPLDGFLIAIWLTNDRIMSERDIERFMRHPLYAGMLDADMLWKPGQPMEA